MRFLTILFSKCVQIVLLNSDETFKSSVIKSLQEAGYKLLAVKHFGELRLFWSDEAKNGLYVLVWSDRPYQFDNSLCNKV